MSATRGKFWLWVVQKRGQAQTRTDYSYERVPSGGKVSTGRGFSSDSVGSGGENSSAPQRPDGAHPASKKVKLPIRGRAIVAHKPARNVGSAHLSPFARCV